MWPQLLGLATRAWPLIRGGSEVLGHVGNSLFSYMMLRDMLGGGQQQQPMEAPPQEHGLMNPDYDALMDLADLRRRRRMQQGGY